MKNKWILPGLMLAALCSGSETLWMENGENLKTSETHSTSCWFNKGIAMTALPQGGFSAASHAVKYVRVDPEYRYLTFEITGSERLPGSRYHSWGIHLDKLPLCGNVREVSPGLYTLRLPPVPRTKSSLLRFYIYGLKVNFKYLKLEKAPENRLEILLPEGKKELEPGDKIKVLLTLQEPCEDVSCQLFFDFGTGPGPFNLNGTNTIELKPLDKPGKIWGTEMEIKHFQASRPVNRNSVGVKATVLGGKIDVPLWSRIDAGFQQPKQTKKQK